MVDMFSKTEVWSMVNRVLLGFLIVSGVELTLLNLIFVSNMFLLAKILLAALILGLYLLGFTFMLIVNFGRILTLRTDREEAEANPPEVPAAPKAKEVISSEDQTFLDALDEHTWGN